MGLLRRERIEWKTPEQVRLMRRAGLVVADALEAVRDAVAPGVTTGQLDAVAERVIRGAGAEPSFLGYQGFPASLCVSVNEEVVHGIPGERVLRDGDVVSVDCGAVVGGWHGDAAFSAVVDGGGGAVDPEDLALVEATEASMWAGLAALATAERLGEVGAAVEDAVGGRYGIVEGYVGHGIGTAMHQPPEVLNHRSRDRGPRVRPGLCVAVEPMVARGGAETDVLEDDWTVVTTDGSRAAHWESTVAVHEGGLWVLTARDGGAAGLARHGVVAAPLD
ncbi:type I methionyl aminopeptidase [uncultured Pseudokineococcus sp.]|uniref:type I methionyl aminopeptidase n=1 Tax=uncultured Pseudokineococcus sp. TaxID=1642928 RepID=UPI0026389E3B|nr:type I methionyl aminopeptidase [uncultured Pseudokineococcus sp.]